MICRIVYHQRGEAAMRQGILPYKYEQERSSRGTTALGGLPVYLDLGYVMGFSKQVRTIPSPSSMFRYLANFHNEGQEKLREAGKAFIPKAK